MLAARLLGFQSLFGLLSGGATAICGASAAMALSAALPAHPQKERATLFTVVGISALSTLAMIVYPIVVRWLELDAAQAGIFLGGTIHDVAQVVGAGYGMSQETGDAATVECRQAGDAGPVRTHAGIVEHGSEAVDLQGHRRIAADEGAV